MFADRGRSNPAYDTDLISRAVAASALAALAVIHVVDLPGTLGPDRLVGVGYIGIIAAAIGVGGAIIARSGWLVWAAAGQLALPAGHRRAQRGDPHPPARGGLDMAGA